MKFELPNLRENYLSNNLTEITNQISKATEQALYEQLRELVDRGLIVLERTEPTFTVDGDNKLYYNYACRLVPQEFDYIKKLEDENADLRRKVKHIADVLMVRDSF